MAEEEYIPCTLKTLPEEQTVEAAERAAFINPANRPAAHALAAAGDLLPPEHLALLTTKYWGTGGVHLSVSFLDTNDAQLKARIVSHMNAWGRWCNASFSEAQGPNGQVRIARKAGDGYWSYHGTDIQQIPAGQPTMNLDSFSMNTPESEYHRVVRHETGHTMGFPHEHRRKAIVDRIDPDKAIAYFKATQGWSEAEIREQVLTPIPASQLTASAATDTVSIMCYALPASIMRDGVAVPGGLDIDCQDAYTANSLYRNRNTATATIWPNGKAYFFKGSQYLRYDPVTDATDAGYPRAIAGNWPGFPPDFAAGVDADVLWPNGKAYFFKGDRYIRYDIAADRVDPGYPASTAANWRGLGGHKIDCGVVWPNGKAYFFSGSQYLRYDIAADKVDAGYPADISTNWHGMTGAFSCDLDAGVVWDNGKAYFFKGSQYVRYDIAADKVDAGYPKPILPNWPGFFASDVSA